jgi:hypothetical protein
VVAGTSVLDHKCPESLVTELRGAAPVLLYRGGSPSLFCEPNQLAHLVGSDTFLNNVLLNLATVLLGVAPLTGIIYFYSKR